MCTLISKESSNFVCLQHFDNLLNWHPIKNLIFAIASVQNVDKIEQHPLKHHLFVQLRLHSDGPIRQ